ncbi:MAG: metallophosphoesterase [Oscillospiraceae bacterium]|nr:metallophosphoesterase [Oscillospiraceae bacterium]
MVYVTGDLHGDLDRLSARAAKALKKGDTLVVCGDFGFLWEGGAAEQKTLQKLGSKKYRILFVDGCHENYELLDRYPVSQMFGGQVQLISGGLVHLLRGEVYTIEEKTIFAMGGGVCTDQADRMATGHWSPRELPSGEEYARARENLEKHSHIVDYVITHDCSSAMRHFIGADDAESTELQTFLDEVTPLLHFKKWFFGLYHLDKNLPPRHRAIFQDIVPLP